MRRTFSTLYLLPLLLAGVAAACGSIPNETAPPPLGQEFQPAGVLHGTVVYTGPHPCSKNGHIVGEAPLLVFDRRVLPPPNGLAQAPVNFAIVTGDQLFVNEPRNPGTATYCPADHGITDSITVSAPFTVAPVAGGEYIIDAFYDYTGDFLPNFKYSLFPELGDITGGFIDEMDARKPTNVGNQNYHTPFLPVDVGTPTPLPAVDGGPPNPIPNFVIPDTGLVVDNITVTINEPLQTRRPYFYPAGAVATFDSGAGTLLSTEVQSSAKAAVNMAGIKGTTETDPNYFPILTIPQDLQVLAGPNDSTVEASVNKFEATLPRIVLHWAVPKAEYPAAVAPPFHFQLPTKPTEGFPVWQDALFDSVKKKWVPQDIPEGGGVPHLWPLIVLTKLIDDPQHQSDPSSTKTQAGVGAPVVILEGITLLAGDGLDMTKPDSLYNTGQSAAFGNLFDPASGQPTVFTQDHVTAVLRPAAICFDALADSSNPDKRGTLVLPHLHAMTSDITNPTLLGNIFNESSLMNPTNAALVDASKTTEACFPTGRYAVNAVYPNGQVWTVPNEAGGCAKSEGTADYSKLSCTLTQRGILASQGTRAVVEITPATNPANCAGLKAPPVACTGKMP